MGARRWSRVLAGLLVASASLIAVEAGPASGANPELTFRHVFVVVMENRSFQDVMSDPAIARIAARGGVATTYDAVAHPSLPNYLALAAGSTFGITSDCVTCYVNAPNLLSQLAAAHVSYDAYFEGAPGPCFLATYGGNGYASKHNPFRYFGDVRASRSICSHLRPYSDFAPTLRRPAASVPSFQWVTPNLCHDGHDCSTGVAATWLTGFVNRVTTSAAYRDAGLLIITWDEGVDAVGGGGRVATIVISARVTPGTRVAAPLDHYSVLATVEDAFGLTRLGHARGARSLAAFFTAGATLTG
ncbi:MAG: alkaline phosphatase family protein [Acidimicrobiales bacterium]